MSAPRASSSRHKRHDVKPDVKSDVKPDIKPDVTPLKVSRASPPPKDDFDLDAADDARFYKTEQQLETERQRQREQNKILKAEGKRPKRLPAKPKRDSTSSRRRRRSDDESDEDEESSNAPRALLVSRDPRELVYEGQIILGFNPLEELAKLEPGQEVDEEVIKQGVARPQSSTPRRSKLHGVAPAALGNGLLTWAKAEVNPSTATVMVEVGTVKQEDVKPPTPPDTKPVVPADCEPVMTPDAKPVFPDREVKAKLLGSLSDVKPSVSALLVADGAVENTSGGVEGEGGKDDEEDEEEDYGENDLIVTPWGQSRPLQLMEDEEEFEDEVYSEDEVMEFFPEGEVEEVYAEDEPHSSSLNSSAAGSLSLRSTLAPLSQSQSLVEVGSKVLAVNEKPRFPCSEEQRLIGPYQIDPDDPGIAIPASINRFLREYQRVGVNFLYSRYKQGYGGVLGDDMGLGKTVQVISFLSAIMRKTGTSMDERRRKKLIRGSALGRITPERWPTALIVSPTSLVDNWSRELQTWGYFEYEVLVTGKHKDSIEFLKNGYLDILLMSNELCIKFANDLKNAPLSVVIVDEAHRMKKANGRLAFAVKKLKARACFALTGTLIQNRMEEMWSILDFVHRGWAGTIKEWREYAAKPVSRGHRSDGTILEVCRAIKRVGELKNRILPHFYVRRDKTLIAHELPKKRDLVVLCPLAKQQEAVYQRVVESEDMAFILSAKEPCDCGSNAKRITCCHETNSQGDDYRTAILKMFHALGRCANHLALLYSEPEDHPRTKAISERIFQFCTGLPYDPNYHNKLEAAMDPLNCGKWTLLQALLLEWRSHPEENNKVLVFSNSVRLLKMIEVFINTTATLSGFTCELFAGEVDKANRMSIVDRFQDPNGDLSVMLVSTLAGGVGLNLTAANKVVIFDPNWNPANDLQAMDRAFRIGQNRPVDVYRLIGQGTVEEMMYERQIYKQQRARQMNQGTFERRTHAGYEGATDRRDKGELFGIHNLFRYWPQGYVKGNLQRIREVEDQFRQDMVDAEYEEESDDEDEEGVAAQRRARDQRKAAQAAAEEDSLLGELTSDGAATSSSKDFDVLATLGISPMDHDKAFRDSPEERQTYEMGLEILKTRPDLARMLANDISRLPAGIRPAKRARKSDERKADVVDEPWKQRLAVGKSRNQGKQLVVSDDDDDDDDE